ncbi:MAG: hypothetical protein NC187_06395 [Candidatus Amulumruptor caecigallinarius]|nr:hypothetical protein [Candidatus Amulumruptor caecigallinarius]MCM1397100.1 hypothetical protein [Candidatus Amulumruptor caecigallinarius]MCM1454086.1 hypothetical protein [bacterium]
MKKLVYILAVSFGASMFAACGSSDKAAEAADTTAVVEEAVEAAAVVDSTAAGVDTTVVVADSVAAAPVAE